MPAAAVIHKGQALPGIIGRKASAGGNISSSGDIAGSLVSSTGPLYQAQLNNGTTGGPRFTLGGITDADSFLSIEASGGINKIDRNGKVLNSFVTNPFDTTSIENDFFPVFKKFYSSEELRTCKKCGHVMEVDDRFV